MIYKNKDKDKDGINTDIHLASLKNNFDFLN